MSYAIVDGWKFDSSSKQIMLDAIHENMGPSRSEEAITKIYQAILGQNDEQRAYRLSLGTHSVLYMFEKNDYDGKKFITINGFRIDPIPGNQQPKNRRLSVRSPSFSSFSGSSPVSSAVASPEPELRSHRNVTMRVKIPRLDLPRSMHDLVPRLFAGLSDGSRTEISFRAPVIVSFRAAEPKPAARIKPSSVQPAASRMAPRAGRNFVQQAHPKPAVRNPNFARPAQPKPAVRVNPSSVADSKMASRVEAAASFIEHPSNTVQVGNLTFFLLYAVTIDQALLTKCLELKTNLLKNKIAKGKAQTFALFFRDDKFHRVLKITMKHVPGKECSFTVKGTRYLTDSFLTNQMKMSAPQYENWKKQQPALPSI